MRICQSHHERINRSLTRLASWSLPAIHVAQREIILTSLRIPRRVSVHWIHHLRRRLFRMQITRKIVFRDSANFILDETSFAFDMPIIWHLPVFPDGNFMSWWDYKINPRCDCIHYLDDHVSVIITVFNWICELSFRITPSNNHGHTLKSGRFNITEKRPGSGLKVQDRRVYVLFATHDEIRQWFNPQGIASFTLHVVITYYRLITLTVNNFIDVFDQAIQNNDLETYQNCQTFMFDNFAELLPRFLNLNPPHLHRRARDNVLARVVEEPINNLNGHFLTFLEQLVVITAENFFNFTLYAWAFNRYQMKLRLAEFFRHHASAITSRRDFQLLPPEILYAVIVLSTPPWLLLPH